MEFRIRKNGKYLDVSLHDGGTVIYLGLLDDKERIDLARKLEEAVDDITDGIENDD